MKIRYIIVFSGLLMAFAMNKRGKTPDSAPEIKAITMTGDSITPASLNGKIVVVNVWATWCVPCVAEIPALDSLAKEFPNDKVVFIAITGDDSTKVKSMFSQRNIGWVYNQVTNRQGLATEFASKRVLGMSMTGYPTNMVIDKEGNIAFCVKGSRKDMKDQLRSEINKLLN